MSVTDYRKSFEKLFNAAADRLPKAFRTLKFRLMALITGLLLVVVGLPVALFVHHLDENYHQFSTNMLDITTLFVYQYVYGGLMEHDSLRIQQNLELLSGDPRIRLVRIHTTDGRILFSTHEEEIDHNVHDKQDIASPENFHTINTHTRHGNTYAYQHPIYVERACTACHENEGATIGYVDVVANFTDSVQIYDYAKKFSVLGGGLIILVLLFSINLLYEGQIEVRLQKFIHGFGDLAKGNYHAKITMNGRHELALLAECFNETVRTLEQARQREDQFYQEKLERADRLVTLGEISAEIAHEVNNPTGIIRSRAELVRDEIAEKDPSAPHIEDIDLIIQQTERIAEITRSILHYARKHPRSFESTDLNEVIRHSIKILQPRLKKLHLNTTLDLPDTPSYVWGSFNQLEQVCCNLINNSLDAIKNGDGRIEIGVRKGSRDGVRDTLYIDFADNGPGIPEELRRQIFSPFFTTKTDGKGTGLGLFIARNIVENHRGTLSLDPDAEKGAHFIVELDQYHG